MSRFFISILFLFTSFCLSAQIQNLSLLIKKIDPSIVKIYTLNENDEYESQGSGVLISNNGVCISNYHVLIGAKNAIVVTASGKKFEINKIIDYSKTNDLIKFKINTINQITSHVVMNSILPMKGSDVFAVGYPNGFNIEGESTLSTGIISGTREINGEKILQTSTPFTHGSSGGGLFDSNGKLIGITAGTFADDIKDRHANLNKVIPVSLIMKLNRNLDLTLNAFYETIQNDENFIKGIIAYEASDFQIAIDYFVSHLKDYPEDATAWFKLGNSFNQLGRLDIDKELLNSALDCFKIAISLDKNNYFPYGQAALVCLMLGELELAKSYSITAYQMYPNISFLNYVVGRVSSESKEFEVAIKFFGSAIDKASELDKINSVHQWYLERAIANSWLKYDIAAENDFKQCLLLNSRNFDALFWYGNFLAIRNRISESCIQFKKLKQLKPDYEVQGVSVNKLIQSNKCYYNNESNEKSAIFNYERSQNSIQIDKIFKLDGFTLVKLTVFPSKEYSSGWNTNFHPDSFILQNGRKYFLLKSDNIPLAPNRHYFTNINDKLSFTLYFDNSIDLNYSFNLIEIEGSNSAYNFYNIKKQ